MQLRGRARESFEQNEVIEFEPGERMHQARLDTILRTPTAARIRVRSLREFVTLADPRRLHAVPLS